MESKANAMTIDVEAIYENGVLNTKQPVDLPENAEVHVTIQAAIDARTSLGRRLRELRAEIARSGLAPLGWDQIESEVALRRGGWVQLITHELAESREAKGAGFNVRKLRKWLGLE